MDFAPVRRLDRSDLPAIARFLAACHRDDPAIHDLSLPQLERWTARARPVLAGAGADDGLSAFAYATESWCGREERTFLHVRIFVPAARRRRGWGTLVLRWLESLPVAGERPGIQSSVPDTWTHAGPFYAHHGFEPALVDLEMQRPAGPVDVPSAPEGVRARMLDPGVDAPDILRVHHAAYAEDPTFDDLTTETLAAQAARPGFRAAGAFRADELVGFVLTVGDGRAAGQHVESLAVVPAARRTGIGAWLLGRALAESAATSSVTLDVHADNPARRLYERFGFAEVGREVTWRRDLRAT